MPEFLELLPPSQALERLLEYLGPLKEHEQIAAQDALGRVTAEPILARHPLPAFPRTTVDGYAVRAADTYGANESLPAYLNWKGEVPMGSQPVFAIGRGECATIHTGGMLPEGADAAVMVEHTQSAREGEIEILRSVAVGENIIKVGEDVARGDAVITAGVRLRPAEIGGLMALGITELNVARQPVVGIISSGDEVIPPDQEPSIGQVRDVNAYTLSALVEQAGGLARGYGIVPDRAEALYEAASRALQATDMVVITAGSSASVRDLTADVINRLGQPGVLVHGVNVRPGKPTILGVCQGKPVIGLPGNPVSALVIAALFVTPVVEILQGLNRKRFRPAVTASLALNLASQAGREDWVPVRLVENEDGGYLADPIFGKSNLIFTLVRADGLIRIPADANGLSAGTVLDVYLI